jgi:integrase
MITKPIIRKFLTECDLAPEGERNMLRAAHLLQSASMTLNSPLKTAKDRIETITVYPGDLIPWLTVGMFAGLRPEEAKRLEWQDIDFRRKHIDLPARKAKGRKRRIIPAGAELDRVVGALPSSERGGES